MLLWMWFGIILTMSWAVQVVYFNQNNDGLGFEDFKAIGVLASPIFYMKKSVSDMWSLEDVECARNARLDWKAFPGRIPFRLEMKEESNQLKSRLLWLWLVIAKRFMPLLEVTGQESPNFSDSSRCHCSW